MIIGSYFINGYWWLSINGYWWLSIDGYWWLSINGYWWLFYSWLLVVIVLMVIGDYSINGY